LVGGRGVGGEGSQSRSQTALTLALSQGERGRNTLPFTVHLVDSPDAFDDFLTQLREQRCFSLDTETTDVRPRWAELVGMSFAWSDAEAWYLPLKSPAGQKHLDADTVLAALKPILENPQIEKIGQNIKYDMIVLRSAGIELCGVTFDTMVASYLLEAGQRNHNLDELARVHLGHETIKISELIGRGKGARRLLPERPFGCFAQKAPGTFSAASRGVNGYVYFLSRHRSRKPAPRSDAARRLRGVSSAAKGHETPVISGVFISRPMSFFHGKAAPRGQPATYTY
jgi:hypothetical protein